MEHRLPRGPRVDLHARQGGERPPAVRAPARLRARGAMPKLIQAPATFQAAGTKPKRIDEYVGRVNTSTESASIAHMRSPSGWSEPGQTPEFDEYTVVIRGMLRVEHAGGVLDVHAGQAVIT